MRMMIIMVMATTTVAAAAAAAMLLVFGDGNISEVKEHHVLNDIQAKQTLATLRKRTESESLKIEIMLTVKLFIVFRGLCDRRRRVGEGVNWVKITNVLYFHAAHVCVYVCLSLGACALRVNILLLANRLLAAAGLHKT